MNTQLVNSLTKIILSLSEEERNLLNKQTNLDNNNSPKLNTIQQNIIDLEIQLKNYENKYKMSSYDFYTQFRQGKLGDDIDLFEWSVFYEMLLSAKEELK
ncbi:hypothetical protein ACN4EE_02280 [Geminocystis sp. CENA526]|uniref:hypothetical protein n=1 Tax=Geminocystis sp. CENA526 TaxID=1355871 RepID=UPI003D6ECFD6